MGHTGYFYVHRWLFRGGSLYLCSCNKYLRGCVCRDVIYSYSHSHSDVLFSFNCEKLHPLFMGPKKKGLSTDVNMRLIWSYCSVTLFYMLLLLNYCYCKIYLLGFFFWASSSFILSKYIFANEEIIKSLQFSTQLAEKNFF